MTTNGNEERPLPDGWSLTTLGEFRVDSSNSINPGKQPEREFELYSVPSYESGFPEIVPGSEIGSSKRVVRENTVLLCKINPRINRVWVVGNHTKHEKIASTEWIPFDEVKGIIPKYLRFFMLQNSFRDFLAQNASGVGGSLMRIKPATFEDYPFPIAPLFEQERIVAEIEKQFTRLDQAVGSLRRVQEKLARYKASVLKAACEGRLVAQDENDEPASVLLARILTERQAQWEAANPKKKYKEPAGVDTAELPELPEGWVWTTMDQISEQRLGKMLDKSKNTGKLRPYLRNANVRWFEFDLSDIQELRASDSELEDISVKYGDLVICEGGEPGRSAVWEKDEPFVIQKALHRVRTTNGISPWYLNFRLASDASIGRLEKYFTGSTIKHFTGQSLRSYLVSLPPTEEQKRIVAEVERRLSVVAATEQVIATNLVRADRLRQSILNKAFTGQLVSQNPEEESANLLLERIKEDRFSRIEEEKKKPKKPRKTTMNTIREKKSLYEILKLSETTMKPEELFRRAGFVHDTIDDFYSELRDAVSAGQILVTRKPNGNVLLEAIG